MYLCLSLLFLVQLALNTSRLDLVNTALILSIPAQAVAVNAASGAIPEDFSVAHSLAVAVEIRVTLLQTAPPNLSLALTVEAPFSIDILSQCLAQVIPLLIKFFFPLLLALN